MASKADGSIVIDTRVDTKGMERGTSQIEGMFSKTIQAAKKVGAAIAAAFAIKQIIAFSKACIDLGSDLEEVQNVVDVTFGEMSGVIEKFSHDAITQFGLSELSAKQYTSTMGAMLKSMGFTGDAVTEMSIKMAELTGDMASFYNLDTDTAFQKIRSGISGETEPLKQLGINMSEVNLEQFRMSQGMTKAYSQMTQQEKALLRYNYLLSVTSDAQGDFARTSGSWANQTRILNLQLQSIKANLGQGLINVLTPALKVINTMIQGLAKLASAFKAFTVLLTGKKGEASTSAGAPIADTASDYTDAASAAENYADATEETAKATKQAAKETRKYLSGLDEIHRYESNKDTSDTTSTPAASKGKTAELPSAAASAMQNMDFGTLEKGDTVVDKLAEKMKALFDAVKAGVQPTVDALKRLWSEGLQKLGQFTWQGLKDFYNGFLVPVASWTMGEGLPRVINAINNGLMNVNWERINGGLRNLWGALKPFAIHIGEGLVWLWENALVPLGTWTMNEAVPRFLDTVSHLIETFDAVLQDLKPHFQWFWNEVLKPIAEWVADKFLDAWDWINEKLSQFTDWAKENPETVQKITDLIVSFFAAWAITDLVGKISGLIEIIGGLFTFIASKVSLPLLAIGLLIWTGIQLYKNWDEIKAKAIEIWGAISDWLIKKWELLRAEVWLKFETIKSKIEKIWTNIKEKSQEIWGVIYDNTIGKVIELKDNIIKWFDVIKTSLGLRWSSIKLSAIQAWDNIKTALVNRVTSIKTKILDLAELIKTGFVGAFNGIVELIKTPINAIIGFVNSMIQGVVDGINGAIGALNHLSFSLPDWMGGAYFGLNIPYITEYPYIQPLARGGVIPPNSPFLAMMGDQKHGTNIEAPLDTIKQALSEVMGSGNQQIRVTINLDGRVVFDDVLKQARQQQQWSGNNPFELA